MAEEERAMMCLRVSVAGVHFTGVDGSSKTKCTTCGEEVWISPVGLTQVNSGATVCCDGCFQKMMENESPDDPVEASVLPETIKELFDQLLRDAETKGLEPKPLYETINFLVSGK